MKKEELLKMREVCKARSIKYPRGGFCNSSCDLWYGGKCLYVKKLLNGKYPYEYADADIVTLAEKEKE